MKVSLEDLKQNIMVEHDLDDLLLLELLERAEEAVVIACNVPNIECLCNECGDLFPTAKHSIIVLASTWYQNREAGTFGNYTKLPYSLDFLLSLNQNYYGDGYYRKENM